MSPQGRAQHLSRDVRERAIVIAARFACLSFHCPGTSPAYDATRAALAELYQAGTHVDELAVEKLIAAVVTAHTDTEEMAVDRIKNATSGKAGPGRLVAAYRANAGVLAPDDVERIAAE